MAGGSNTGAGVFNTYYNGGGWTASTPHDNSTMLGVVWQIPSYVASINPGPSGASPYEQSGSVLFDDPSAPGTQTRGLLFQQSLAKDTWHTAFTFTLATNADFVLTSLVDNHMWGGNGSQQADGITMQAERVTGPTSSASITTLTSYASATLTPNAVYTAFEIRGNAGDTFTIAVETGDNYRDSGTPYTGYSFGAIGFETVPEPSTLVLLASGLIGLLCYAWRRRK